RRDRSRSSCRRRTSTPCAAEASAGRTGWSTRGFLAQPRTSSPIPLSRPYLDEREEELVLEVLRSGRLSLGPAIDRFEELFAARTGAPFAAAVTSGTAALHLLCHMAGFGPGDEVIPPPIALVS